MYIYISIYIYSYLSIYAVPLQVVKSMSKDETEYTTQIIGLRRQQELFQEDLQRRNMEYDQLQSQYQSLRNTIKQVSILRQQHVIETLEAKVGKQGLELGAMDISRRALSEAEAHLKDRVRLVSDELDELRRMHELSIVELRPVLENYILQTQGNRAALQKMRSEVEISAVRLGAVEEGARRAAAACAAKEAERQYALSLLKSERGVAAWLRSDLASQKRVLTSAAAANIQHKALIKDLRTHVATAESSIRDKDARLLAYEQEVSELRARAAALEQTASAAVAGLDASVQEHRQTQSLLALQSVELQGMQREIDEFSAQGFTPERRAEFEGMKRNVVIAKEENIRFREQKKALERKIQDLEFKQKPK
jgi:chromosome segregation ATPase